MALPAFSFYSGSPMFHCRLVHSANYSASVTIAVALCLSYVICCELSDLLRVGNHTSFPLWGLIKLSIHLYCV